MWGRDCWCEPGEDNRCLTSGTTTRSARCRPATTTSTCSRTSGYNLKATDLAAALGLAQLAAAGVASTRRRRAQLRPACTRRWPTSDDVIIRPRTLPGAYSSSWFGYYFTLREGDAVAPYGTCSGSCWSARSTRGCCWAATCCASRPSATSSTAWSGELDGADTMTERSLWVGTWPGLTTRWSTGSPRRSTTSWPASGAAPGPRTGRTARLPVLAGQVGVEDADAARFARPVRLGRCGEPGRSAPPLAAAPREVADDLALHRRARHHAGRLDVVARRVRPARQHVQERVAGGHEVGPARGHVDRLTRRHARPHPADRPLERPRPCPPHPHAVGAGRSSATWSARSSNQRRSSPSTAA